jgi:hypothetical protein
VGALLSRVNDELKEAAEILTRNAGGPVYRATFRRLLWLTYSDDNDLIAAKRLQAEALRNETLLRLLIQFDWIPLVEPSGLSEVSASEINGHRERLKRASAKGASAARDELRRYSRARSVWLQLDQDSE